MRYLLCEDGKSGYYFWSLIKEHILKDYYEIISLDKINNTVSEKKKSKSLGINVIKNYFEHMHKTNSIRNDDTYIVCIDNVMDNIEVNNTIQKYTK